MSFDVTSPNTFYELLTWAELNKKRILLATAALLVLGGAVGAFLASRNQRERRASELLATLVPSQMSGQKLGGLSSGSYLDLVKNYPKTRAAQSALLLAAEGLFSAGRYAEARQQFEKFRQEYPESPLLASAAYGVAACLEAENKSDQALTAYQEVVSRYPGEATYGQSKFALARLLERKEQFQRALEIYNELSRPNVASAWSSDAAMAREQLLARHPELAPTNVASANPASAALPLSPDLLRALNQATGAKPANIPAPPAKTSVSNQGAARSNVFQLTLTNLPPAQPAAPSPPARKP